MLAGAPLIICPLAGDQISKKRKEVCKKFKSENKINVKVCEHGEIKMGNTAKPDPLSPSSCKRED